MSNEICGQVNDSGLADDQPSMYSLQDILSALRELHDFADISRNYKHERRSAEAFDKAADILRQFGAEP